LRGARTAVGIATSPERIARLARPHEHQLAAAAESLGTDADQLNGFEVSTTTAASEPHGLVLPADADGAARGPEPASRPHIPTVSSGGVTRARAGGAEAVSRVRIPPPHTTAMSDATPNASIFPPGQMQPMAPAPGQRPDRNERVRDAASDHGGEMLVRGATGARHVSPAAMPATGELTPPQLATSQSLPGNT